MKHKLSFTKTTNGIPHATKKQIGYMEILFNDLGFDTRQKRTDYLILRNIGVNYLDEMTVRQAQIVISELVERRGNGRVQDAEAHAYGRPNGECDDGPDDGLPF